MIARLRYGTTTAADFDNSLGYLRRTSVHDTPAIPITVAGACWVNSWVT
jgi:hypothetical protein